MWDGLTDSWELLYIASLYIIRWFVTIKVNTLLNCR